MHYLNPSREPSFAHHSTSLSRVFILIIDIILTIKILLFCQFESFSVFFCCNFFLLNFIKMFLWKRKGFGFNLSLGDWITQTAAHEMSWIMFALDRHCLQTRTRSLYLTVYRATDWVTDFVTRVSHLAAVHSLFAPNRDLLIDRFVLARFTHSRPDFLFWLFFILFHSISDILSFIKFIITESNFLGIFHSDFVSIHISFFHFEILKISFSCAFFELHFILWGKINFFLKCILYLNKVLQKNAFSSLKCENNKSDLLKINFLRKMTLKPSCLIYNHPLLNQVNSLQSVIEQKKEKNKSKRTYENIIFITCKHEKYKSMFSNAHWGVSRVLR